MTDRWKSCERWIIGLLLLLAAWVVFCAAGTNVTDITLDGEADDWAGYGDVTSDPADDALGSVEIAGVLVLANADSVYALVVLKGDRDEVQQIDLEFAPVTSGGRVHARVRIDQGQMDVTIVEDGNPIDQTGVGEYAVGAVLEARFPRELFENEVPEAVLVRLVDRTHGKEAPADEAECVVTIVDEIDSAAVAADGGLLFCRCTTTTGAFPPAPQISVPAGYRAEYFIAPSGLNTPSDVVGSPDGGYLVASSRARAIHWVHEDGTIEVFAEGHAYAIDCDSEGTLYGYNFPTGEIFLIEPGRPFRTIAEVPDTACESTLAVAPDGTLYVGHNACSGDSIGGTTIYRISAGGGSPEVVTARLQGIAALDVASDGQLFAASGGCVLHIDLDSGVTRTLADLPIGISFHGLDATDGQTLYVSTGDFATAGDIYRMCAGGDATLMAHFAGNGIEGIAVTSDGTVIGTQRAIGGLQAVDPDGSVRAVVEPNGLVSPHSLAIGPCGEVVTVNDEAGRLTSACADGTNDFLLSIISYQPPQTFIAISPDGWLVAGESAPGFPSRLNRYSADGTMTTMADDLDNVSGVAIDAQGRVYAASTGDGLVVRFEEDGQRTVLASGLQTPQALAVADDGTVYVVTGGAGFGDVFAIPSTGDTVVVIPEAGSHRRLASIEGAAALAIGPDGDLFIAAGSAVYRIDPWGIPLLFAGGFQSARGLAFDPDGRLYVADDDGNAIVRIVPEA